MKLLTGITDDPKQNCVIALDDGTQAALYLEYRPQQQGWFFDLTTKTFSVIGQRIAAFPNILRQYSHQIDFGLAIVVAEKRDPLLQTDFASGYASMVLLNADDVIAIERAKFTRND